MTTGTPRSTTTSCSRRAIRRARKTVDADLINKELDKHGASLEAGEERRIKQAIERASNIPGYDVSTGHRFSLVEEFHETLFEKVSPGGLQSQRYFDIADELGLDEKTPLPTPEEIAKGLKGKTWR